MQKAVSYCYRASAYCTKLCRDRYWCSNYFVRRSVCPSETTNNPVLCQKGQRYRRNNFAVW